MTVAFVSVERLMVEAELPVPTTTAASVVEDPEGEEVIEESPLEVALALLLDWLELPPFVDEAADELSDEDADEDEAAASEDVEDAAADDAVLDGCALLACVELAWVDCTLDVMVVSAAVELGVFEGVVVGSEEDSEVEVGAAEDTLVDVGSVALLGEAVDESADDVADETAVDDADDAPVLKLALLFCRLGKTPSGN